MKVNFCPLQAMGQAEEDSMDPLIFDGYVTLNAEGRQYTASFHLGSGVIIVRSGSVSRVMQLGHVAVEPQSVARTILRTIVTEYPQYVEVKQPGHDQLSVAGKH
jgi:hypothetical protein